MYEKNGRLITLDLDQIHIPDATFLKANREAWKTRQRKKKLDPWSDPFLKRKYADPEELRKKAEEYFESCFGIKYYKGHPMFDADGEPLRGQVEPYTLSGLARFLGISRGTLRNYELKSKAGLIPPEYYEVIQEARARVEEYAEKRLYDRDGSTGARFVLEAGFGWMTEKDRKELKQSKKRIKVSQDKLKLLQAAAEAKEMDDKEFIVNILRASNDD